MVDISPFYANVIEYYRFYILDQQVLLYRTTNKKTMIENSELFRKQINLIL